MKRRTIALSIAALIVTIVAPASAEIGEEQRATAKTRGAGEPVAERRAMPALGEAFSQAIAIQGDLAAGDWDAARMHMAELQGQLRLARTRQLPAETRQRLEAIAPVVDNLQAGLAGRDPARARTAAYHVVNAFLTSLDTLATAGGGGGGVAPLVPAETAMEAVQIAYRAAGQAQLALWRQEAAEAALQLELAALQLREARAAGLEPALAQRLTALEERVASAREAIGDPDRAATEVRRAVVAFSEAMRAVSTARLAPEDERGGGGGPTPGAEAQDDMDRLIEMEQRGRDRPNQRGRQ